MKPLAALLCAMLLAACVGPEGSDRVNGSVDVAEGQPLADASTVNGAIRVAENAAVKAATTVNGSITLGRNAGATSATTVNGSITVGEGAHVTGNIEAVNGAITLRRGADVGGELRNVNGAFAIEAAHVGGGIRTVAGDITIGADSRIDGGIEYEPASGFSISFTKHVPRVVIGPRAVVTGPLEFAREVQLYVSDRARIGAVTGATPIPYSGDQPPAGG
ncbi:MAG: hypothetical protein CMLOHMNK_02264 [Steroidobacteraceae bacterium]|nr:hypothetical protein [Steroidobacteraceae bacterium]